MIELGGESTIVLNIEDLKQCLKYSDHLKKTEMLSKIEKVIFNDPATIVFWSDGTKTVVKCDVENYDPEKGLAMAIVKKQFGNNQGYYYDIFKKWLPKKEEDVTEV